MKKAKLPAGRKRSKLKVIDERRFKQLYRKMPEEVGPTHQHAHVEGLSFCRALERFENKEEMHKKFREIFPKFMEHKDLVPKFGFFGLKHPGGKHSLFVDIARIDPLEDILKRTIEQNNFNETRHAIDGYMDYLFKTKHIGLDQMPDNVGFEETPEGRKCVLYDVEYVYGNPVHIPKERQHDEIASNVYRLIHSLSREFRNHPARNERFPEFVKYIAESIADRSEPEYAGKIIKGLLNRIDIDMYAAEPSFEESEENEETFNIEDLKKIKEILKEHRSLPD